MLRRMAPVAPLGKNRALALLRAGKLSFSFGSPHPCVAILEQDGVFRVRELVVDPGDAEATAKAAMAEGGLLDAGAAFYVSSNLFATCGEKHGMCQITFGLEPDHAAALVESDPRIKPYPRDKRGVVLDAANMKSWTEVNALILESYGLQKPKRKPAKKSATKKRTRR